MNRRRYLAGLAGATATTLAGCIGGTGDGGTESGTGTDDGDAAPGDGNTGGGFGSGVQNVPPVVNNRPDAVYVPSHFEGMKMVGMGESGGHKLALSYTLPHRFWTTQADPENPTKRVSIQESDSLHLMASVWHPENGVYVTDASPSITVEKDGETVVGANNPWAMLSQPMGFHFGDNVTLDGDGTYDVTVETSAPTAKRTGDLEGVGGKGTFEFEMEYSRRTLKDIMINRFPDRKGNEGAVGPMDMEMMPLSYAPEAGSMPGRTVGTGNSGDATVVVQEVPDGARFGAGESESYLAVSPRTPHHGFVLPGMSLDATVKRGSETVFDGQLTKSLDPDLNFHYGAVLDPLESGDEVTVEFVSEPQVARHEGYETAFLEMPSVTTTV
jgi:hypothetical protein